MTLDARTSTEWVRRRNTSLVLRSLRDAGPASRAELAGRTGLAKATVGSIITALESGGVVAEEPSRAGARGRPATPVTIRGDRFLGLGLELNVDYVAAVALDLSGTVRFKETRPVAAAQAPDDALVELVTATLGQLRRGLVAELVGATVAVPGLVRADNRTVAWAPNLQITGDRVAARVEQALVGACAVEVSNDADCAAYAETHHGAAADSSYVLYLTGTVGIGAGIVDAGALVRGEAGFAGEVGHMPVGDPDAACGCGRTGCWEASVGLHAMLRSVGMPELETPVASAAAVAARAATDDGVRAALERLGRDVGLGLSVLTTILDPAVVVLGGYFVPLGELVLAEARRTLDARLVAPVQRRPELRVGALGIEAAALGAAEQSLTRVFSGEQELTG
jgi:predicted NBD/HSP70 family sugar kinase